VTVTLTLGILTGIGIVGLATALRPRRSSLSDSLSVVDTDPIVSTSRDRGGFPKSFSARSAGASAEERGRRNRFGISAADALGRMISRLPSVEESVNRDLACADRSLESFAERCLLCCLAGAFTPCVIWAVLSLEGLAVPVVIPIWVAVVGAFAGALIPFVFLRTEGTKARRHARRVVGCFLDLVVLSLAGGLGIEGALYAAAAICETPVSRKLLRGLDVARDSGRTPWEALATTGRELGVTELVELSAAVSLAGTEGARIRSTLAAKAASIRTHELADAESDANTITERLFLPGVLLLIGFLIFLGYPAVSRVTSGL